MGLDNYLQNSHSNQDIPQSSTSAILRNQQQPQHYSFQSVSAHSRSGSQIRFIDSNPRPAKSPRHVSPPPPAVIPQSPSYTNFGSRFAPPYNGSGTGLPTVSEPQHFSSTIPLQQSWTAPPDTGGGYEASESLPSMSQSQLYQFPTESYMKEDSNQQQNYTWNPS